MLLFTLLLAHFLLLLHFHLSVICLFRMDAASPSQIAASFAGQNVFMTGGTGFLGKVLIEKLLRSCPDVGTIYMLSRPKKGKSAQERINAIFQEQVYYTNFLMSAADLYKLHSLENLKIKLSD